MSIRCVRWSARALRRCSLRRLPSSARLSAWSSWAFRWQSLRWRWSPWWWWRRSTLPVHPESISWSSRGISEPWTALSRKWWQARKLSRCSPMRKKPSVNSRSSMTNCMIRQIRPTVLQTSSCLWQPSWEMPAMSCVRLSAAFSSSISAGARERLRSEDLLLSLPSTRASICRSASWASSSIPSSWPWPARTESSSCSMRRRKRMTAM